MVKNSENHFLSDKDYVVKLAGDEEDLKAAQHLRYKVFNLELGEGLPGADQNQQDADKYDPQCDHLLVISKDSGEVIGTYRMQTADMARSEHGFYTANEFDFSGLPAEILDQGVEVGRACIAKAHRNGRVLFLLWRGLAKYMIHYEKRYLFGCCSLTSQSPAEGWAVQKYLEEQGFFHPEIFVSTRASYQCQKVEPDAQKVKDIKLPQLFRLYMDLGAKVCSPPAMDEVFNTIDYLVLLDIEAVDERTRTFFLQ